jgi:hypothetical protein
MQQRLAVLRRLARWSSSAFRIFEELDRRDEASELAEVWPHRSFLIFAGHSLRESSFIWLHALFENDPKTINFASVISDFRYQGIGSEALSEIEAELSRCEPEKRKLARLRGSAVAHRNSKKTYDEHFASVKMTRAEMHILLDVARSVSARLALLGGLSPDPQIWDPADNLGDVLAALVEDTKARQGWFGGQLDGD